MQKVKKVGDFTVLGADGDISDFQTINNILEDKMRSEYAFGEEGSELDPRDIWCYLGRIMYNSRSEMKFLWNSLVFGGFCNGKEFLGYINLQGTCFEENTVCTGFGAAMVSGLLADSWREDLTEQEALKALEDAYRVCLYRDKMSLNRIQVALADASGLHISEPRSLELNFEYTAFQDTTYFGNKKSVELLGLGAPMLS